MPLLTPHGSSICNSLYSVISPPTAISSLLPVHLLRWPQSTSTRLPEAAAAPVRSRRDSSGVLDSAAEVEEEVVVAATHFAREGKY